jgi:hypothetical protein
MVRSEFHARWMAASRQAGRWFRYPAVAQALQRAGLIKDSRGMIQIADIERLREAACECYEAVKSHHAKLLGVAATGPSGDPLAEQT